MHETWMKKWMKLVNIHWCMIPLFTWYFQELNSKICIKVVSKRLFSPILYQGFIYCFPVFSRSCWRMLETLGTKGNIHINYFNYLILTISFKTNYSPTLGQVSYQVIHVLSNCYQLCTKFTQALIANHRLIWQDIPWYL